MGRKIVCISLMTLAIALVKLPSLTQAQNTRSVGVKVGVATILSGDLAILGENAQNTVEIYSKYYLRHPIQFIFEDAKKGSIDGLRSFQSLINFHHADMIIAPMTSNGIIAGANLINSTKTVLITPSTGGSNIDRAGQYIFRVGNSDILNGIQQADLFKERGILKAALLTEDTEYTTDIAIAFRRRFAEIGGQIVFDQSFLPDRSDFRTQIALMLAAKPQAVFVSTQTGQAFGVFSRQLRIAQLSRTFELHTNFVAASNPDAFVAAGEAIYGAYYMAPNYDHNNPELKQFIEYYRKDYSTNPPVAFQAAGIIDALDMLQLFLDGHDSYDSADFQKWLHQNVINYHGLMGEYSFDQNGNTNVGFTPARIDK